MVLAKNWRSSKLGEYTRNTKQRTIPIPDCVIADICTLHIKRPLTKGKKNGVSQTPGKKKYFLNQNTPHHLLVSWNKNVPKTGMFIA